MNVKGKGQRLIPEELLRYLEALKNKYPDAVDLIEANPTLEGGEDSLSSVLINGTKYAVGGGSSELYMHVLSISYPSQYYLFLTVYSSKSEAYTYESLMAENFGVVQITGSYQGGTKVAIGGYIGNNNFQYYGIDQATGTVSNLANLTDYVTKIL